MENTKTCSKCGIEKSLSEFHKRNDRPCGYRKDCKVCALKKHSEYYKLNKETIKEKVKAYSVEKKEKISERRKPYWNKYYEANKDKVNTYQAEYREKNKEIVNERIKKWSVSEHGKKMKIIKEGKRRSLKLSSSDGTVTLDGIMKILENQGNKCKHCECELTKKHLDHITPLSKGGVHSINNVQWLCQTCNIRKGNRYSW